MSRPLVLVYHAVSSSWPSPLAIPEPIMREQLQYLRERGYTGFTFAELERGRLAGTLPRRSVAITFDDGYASVLRAKPILDELDFPGTVYAVTSFPSSGRNLVWPGVELDDASPFAAEMQPLAWDELATLRDSGWEVGSHTVHHRFLPRLDAAMLQRELEESRATVTEHLGSCETIAYPYGASSPAVVAATRAAGYLAGCTGTFVHEFDDQFRRPRVELHPADRGRRLRFQVSGVALALRRSAPAKLARRLRRKRDWIPANA